MINPVKLKTQIFSILSILSFYLFYYFYFKNLFFGYSNKIRVNIISVIGNDSTRLNDTLLITLLLVYDIVYLQIFHDNFIDYIALSH